MVKSNIWYSRKNSLNRIIYSLSYKIKINRLMYVSAWYSFYSSLKFVLYIIIQYNCNKSQICTHCVSSLVWIYNLFVIVSCIPICVFILHHENERSKNYIFYFIQFFIYLYDFIYDRSQRLIAKTSIRRWTITIFLSCTVFPLENKY